MCRHLAYLGPSVPIGELLLTPPHSLFRQSWAPRHQQHGTVNADGFGVGWYAGEDPVPARYRRFGPIWADQSFADLARVVRTGALLGAVRDATLRSADGEAAAAPFAEGPWLFSHSGAVDGWPGSLAPLAADLPPTALLDLVARSDSALLWALVLHRLRHGDYRDRAGAALADTVLDVARAAPASRLNFLLTNGSAIMATSWGDALWYRTGPGPRVVVASEPYDDEPGWHPVPERTLLVADPRDVRLTPLKEVAA
ncbi:gamma-glutamyl-hercynylcysteine sulfoxide hydrolase [Streptomyces sulfonofaciens]|uniref:Gamma-glutamyl-hercynylcysteine sulfoxide hydrolase n=1 Tax=Streptomyces sulfonofaciens TaxID=68272 RepID=A0A919FTA5_9ACTN|nr:ergothioneine biosynthesis protein EgtC [Streptomyces sulfonofaciens]GHH71536.1 gamma-glutamyl-hercynylcysteine sulfoxide hydrolase [Streptomyces sulfonofaciens]